MKAIYDYESEYYEFLSEIEDHLTTKGDFISDALIVDCKNIRINGVKVENADSIQLFGNAIIVGIRKTQPVLDGETNEHLGERQYIEPIVELRTTTDGMRLHDLRFERQVGTTDKYRTYHYILE